jgi:hypothetical protein
MSSMSEPRVGRVSRRLQIAVFALFLSLYVLTMKGMCIRDDVLHYERTQNIINAGSLSMPGQRYGRGAQPWLKFFASPGKDGRLYLTLGDGLSLAAVPLGLLGNVVGRAAVPASYEQVLQGIDQERRTGSPEALEARMRALRRMPSAFFAALINPIVMALTVLLFFNFCLALTASLRKAWWGCLVLGTGTIIWAYSSTFWTQPIVTFCILGAFYQAYRSGTEGTVMRLVLAGLLLGYSFITRHLSILALPYLIVYVARSRRRSKQPILRPLVLLLLPVACFLLLQMWWNDYRFGSPLQSGGWHQAEAWASFGAKLHVSVGAMLVGLHKSVFLFSPPLILGLLGLKRFVRGHRLEGEVVVGTVVTYLLVYGHFALWFAPGSWGPRFLVPSTPLLLLPACAFMNGGRWRRAVGIGLFAAGIVVQLIGVLLPLQRIAIIQYLGGFPTVADFFLKPEILPQAKAVLAGNVELWFLEGPAKGAAGAVLAAILVSSLAYCTISVRREDQQRRTAEAVNG